MTDPNDFTPPPREPMPEASKDRIRSQLRAAAAAPGGRADGRGARSRSVWMVPALTAAAVLTVVGGAFAIGEFNDDNGGTTIHPAASPSTTNTPTPLPTTAENPPVLGTPTAGSPSATAPATTTKSEGTPTAPAVTSASQPPTSPPLTGSTTPTAPPSDPPVTASCQSEIRELGQPSLRGATVTAERDYGPGTTYLYETKSAWVVCDDLTAASGGAPTLLQFQSKARPYHRSTSTLAVSQNLITNPDGTWKYDQFVAGGRDFEGVKAISYTFPDGHTEHATVGRNGLWSMVYLATDGVFMDPNTDETRLDPIRVTVRNSYDDYEVVTLRWGLDTCAQLNSGC